LFLIFLTLKLCLITHVRAFSTLCESEFLIIRFMMPAVRARTFFFLRFPVFQGGHVLYCMQSVFADVRAFVFCYPDVLAAPAIGPDNTACVFTVNSLLRVGYSAAGRRKEAAARYDIRAPMAVEGAFREF
jgi:hypothetical protein